MINSVTIAGNLGQDPDIRYSQSGLAIANLVHNKHLARAIGDAAWAEFARQVGYKAAWFGAELVVARQPRQRFGSGHFVFAAGMMNRPVQEVFPPGRGERERQTVPQLPTQFVHPYRTLAEDRVRLRRRRQGRQPARRE